MPQPIIEIICMLAFIGLVYLGVGFYVCRKYTGTWNGLKFVFDRKYWALAVLNHEYAEHKAEMTLDDFILHFATHFLMPPPKGVMMRMRNPERRFLVMIVSQNDFLADNFGQMPYSTSLHNAICTRWEERLKQMSYGEE